MVFSGASAARYRASEEWISRPARRSGRPHSTRPSEAIMLGPVGVVLLGALTLAAPTAHKVHKAHSTFTVTSKDMVPGKPISEAQVYNGGMGCSGQNLSPALSWTNAPSGTKSFAITMYDPDAPTGSG